MNDNFCKKAFIDSNVLVYSIDESDLNKKKKADELLEKLIREQKGQLSTQSLQEFYNVLTKKLGYSKPNVKLLVENLSELFPVEEIKIQSIIKAIDISIRTQFSFWDSLVMAMAIETGCSVLYSEDLNNGQIVEGIEIVNPFI